MKDPLSTLALIYNNFNDTLRLNATLNKVDRIIDLQNEDLSDSIQYDLITFESFDDNIQEESENFIYNQIDLAISHFNQNLFTQSIENLNNSLSMTSNEIGFGYYSNLEIFDDSNLEYLLPAFITQIQFDSLDIKSNFFTSMIHLKLSNYDQALEKGFNYHDDNPDDFKVYELIGDIYFEKESWDDALFYYIRSMLNDKNNIDLKFKIAQIFINSDYTDKAIFTLNEIIEIDPYYF